MTGRPLPEGYKEFLHSSRFLLGKIYSAALKVHIQNSLGKTEVSRQLVETEKTE